MIRLGVVSDSHGDLRLVGHLRTLFGRLDWLVHAGDYLRDADRIASSLGIDPGCVRAVVGNCDHPIREPLHQIMEIAGVRILLTHGHHYGVKEGYQRIYYRAVEAGARVVIFGHSHVPVSLEQGGVLLFNPGSISQPRLPGTPPSCGVLEIDQGQISGQIIYASQSFG